MTCFVIVNVSWLAQCLEMIYKLFGNRILFLIISSLFHQNLSFPFSRLLIILTSYWFTRCTAVFVWFVKPLSIWELLKDAIWGLKGLVVVIGMAFGKKDEPLGGGDEFWLCWFEMWAALEVEWFPPWPWFFVYYLIEVCAKWWWCVIDGGNLGGVAGP